jgi:hypothetical protein
MGANAPVLGSMLKADRVLVPEFATYANLPDGCTEIPANGFFR